MKYKYFIDKIIYKLEKINKKKLILIFFVIFGLTLISKLFSYTVFNYDFYKNLADNQQIGQVVVPVTRGTIYFKSDDPTIAGTSLNLYDVAVDPQSIGNKVKLTTYLSELVYKELCYTKSSEDCYENTLRFLRLIEIEDFVSTEEYVKKLIRDKLEKKIYQEKVTSVFVDKELNTPQIEIINNSGMSGLYITNNYLYINPEEIINEDDTINFLHEVIYLEEDELKSLVRKRDLRYVPIINKISISAGEEIKEYLEDETIAIKKGLLDDSESIGNFIILTPMPHRFYPEKEIASQIVGFVDNSGVGNYGIEGYFDNMLKGNNGKIVSRKDIKGRIIETISLDNNDLIGEGVKIYTTIDRNIQSKVETILEKGVKEYRANKGSVIIMNPKTGEVITMANYPTYDLNNFSDIYELEKVKYSKYPDPKVDLLGIPVFVEDKISGEKFYYDSKEIFLREATREELGDVALVKYKYKNDFGPQLYTNDNISALYEPGSIMKAITVAVGIDSGEIDRYDMYLDEGELQIGDFTIKNVSDKCLGYNTFAHALNFSCNVGMIRIVQKIGKALLYQYLNDFGFSEKTGITLSGEVNSKINNWERWPMSQLLTSSYGLGVSVTPIQMASAYSVLANGGLYMKPRIIDKIETPNGNIIEYKDEVLRRVIKESTSETITSMLNASINDGAAKYGNVEGYSLAGKTGTSQIAYKGVYEEGVGSTTASFAGYGPVQDPKFVVIVKLDRPRSNEYGGQTSAYLFKEIAEYLLDYYGIPKNNL